jgi:hypothetical protein
VTISRAQIPESIDMQEGGDPSETNDDPFADLYSRLADRNTDFDSSYKKYMERLEKLAPQRPRMNIFEVASALGKGLLQTPNTGVGSAFQGLSVGFNNISEKIQADEKMFEEEKRELGMMATQLALQDEQKAEEFLNEIALKRIDAANKEVPYITLEYDEMVDGKKVIKRKRLPDTADYQTEINDLYTNYNAREIKPITSQTTINTAGEGNKPAFDKMMKDQEVYAEKARAALATIDQVAEARELAGRVGEEGFGPFSRATLGVREFVSGIGFGDLLEDEAVIGPQKALNQLSMSFTMGIVSQTKGAISDREMKLFIAASPGLGSTYEGFMEQLGLLERLAKKDSDFYEEYIEKAIELENEMPNDYRQQQLKLEQFRVNWAKENPLFTKEETQKLQSIVDNRTGIAEDFDVSAFEESVNERKNKKGAKQAGTLYTIGGVPGYTYIGVVKGKAVYAKPGKDIDDLKPDDVIEIPIVE